MKRKFINPEIQDEATFTKFAFETGGELTEIDIILQVGGGNDLHYHKTYSETFTAIEGELGVKIGKKKEILILEPGQSFTVPANMLHCFFNPGQKQIRFKVEIAPGHEGFEKAIMIGYSLIENGLLKKNFLRNMAVLLCISDMNIPGVFSIFEPVLKCIAYFSKDYEKALVKKYCAEATTVEELV
ncbi:cupin domain-containing protein [Emticicia sp. BO119]|uniref:cupin domain-containing protein n=1 Tax=Emticicia sp. BO119 TaxID=2757768 RepID=UPI0015F005C7|nr:cupin domain-containing protein [Emticicia sp. BO119]MBA4850373.1 cupin domain-containing protein [Emticicia sp. BO119]